MNLLEKSRLEINEIDHELACLFEKRMHAISVIAQYKAKYHLPIFDAKREAEIIAKNKLHIKDKKLLDFFEVWYRSTVDISKQFQKQWMEENENG